MNIAHTPGADTRTDDITKQIAQWAVDARSTTFSSSARAWARHAILDWMGVTIAGASEPLVDILLEDAGAGDEACVVARGTRASVMDAALINGSASHALDYDDVNRRLMGHPTVGVAPVVLALGESLNSSGADVISAFIVGTEVSCLIAEMAGDDHYEMGFHATGTIGTFGAAAAAAYLLKLDVAQTQMALGIAASQASGLKSNFGTMTKPLHAGRAAANGLFAARLASRGFTATPDMLDCAGGFSEVMMPGFVANPALLNAERPLAVEENLFKYHAACYLIHSTVEAIREIREQHADIKLDDMRAMVLSVRPTHFKVCNIPDPKTGLQIKFSIRHCAVMALDGVDTGALETYTDAYAVNPRYEQARANVTVNGVDNDDKMGAHVRIEMNNGDVLEHAYNVGIPASDIDAQWQKLATKFHSLVVPVMGEAASDALVSRIDTLDDCENIKTLMTAAT